MGYSFFSKSVLIANLTAHANLSNESTTGADASVEALKLYHMKLTV